jgi:zeta-carotene desaturase
VTQPSVAVVGGGVSGLAAAVRLAGRGVRVRLFEVRGVLGGRATSFPDARTGEVFDNGQHALMGCYSETFTFLRTIGSAPLAPVPRGLRVRTIDAGRRPTELSCPRLPPPLHLLAGVLRWQGLPLRDRLNVFAIGPAILKARRAVAARGEMPVLDGETVAQWLARHGQRRAIASMLWEPLALAALNQDISRAEATTFVRVLGRVFGPGRDDASIVLPAVPLIDLFGSPAEKYLHARDAEIRMDALARIVLNEGRVSSVDVRGEAIDVAHAVLATPWHTWPATIAGDVAPIADTLQRAASTPASPIVTVTLTYDRPVIEGPMIGLPGRQMQWAFDTAVLGGASAGHRVALVSSGADEVLRLDNGQLAAAAHRDLASASEAARDGRLLRHRVVREPRATFSLAPGMPQRPATRTAARGLYFASDWVNTGLPATIEGAVEAGHRAADALLEDLSATGAR